MTLREKLVKIGAKVVAHGRYLTFQLAEVEVSALPERARLDTIRPDKGRKPTYRAGSRREVWCKRPSCYHRRQLAGAIWGISVYK